MTGSILIPGPLAGWARARVNHKTGRFYTADTTRTAQDRIREAWRAAGSPGPYFWPVAIAVTVVIRRPKGHFRTDGLTLGAAGERAPIPIKRPDIDNVLKQIGDALNGCLWHDDQQIAHASITRRWAQPGEVEHVRIDYWQASLEDEEFAA